MTSCHCASEENLQHASTVGQISGTPPSSRRWYGLHRKPAAGFFFASTLAKGCFNSSKPSPQPASNSFTNWKRLVRRQATSFAPGRPATLDVGYRPRNNFENIEIALDASGKSGAHWHHRRYRADAWRKPRFCEERIAADSDNQE